MKLYAHASTSALALAAMIIPAQAQPGSMQECMELAVSLERQTEAANPDVVEAKRAEVVAHCQAGNFAAAAQAYQEGFSAAIAPSGNHE